MTHEAYRCILLFGAPGVGKGTQGALLGNIPGFFHLATGDMFRSLDKTSELGKQFLEYSSKGLLVPDELTVDLWEQYLAGKIKFGDYHPHRDLLVLDGIPRSMQQVALMDGRIDVMAIVHLVADDLDEMVRRMKGRAQKQGRHDDADESVIRHRFEVYRNETAPVLSQYDADLIHEINGLATPPEVFLDILKVVVPIRAAQFGNPLAIA